MLNKETITDFSLIFRLGLREVLDDFFLVFNAIYTPLIGNMGSTIPSQNLLKLKAIFISMDSIFHFMPEMPN